MSGIGELLRGRLAPAQPDPELPTGIPAGVLVPVLEADGPSPALLFTVRSQEVRDHRGEISFPGGVRHDEDPDLLATALRETDEELGLPGETFEVLGTLPPVHTVVSGYTILPFVAVVAGRPELRPSPVEIAEVLELEVDRLAEVEEEVRLGTGGWYAYALDGHMVWGATGRIVHSFLEALRGAGWRGG